MQTDEGLACLSLGARIPGSLPTVDFPKNFGRLMRGKTDNAGRGPT